MFTIFFENACKKKILIEMKSSEYFFSLSVEMCAHTQAALTSSSLDIDLFHFFASSS